MMSEKVKKGFLFFIMILQFALISAQTKEPLNCDQLIKKGVNAMYNNQFVEAITFLNHAQRLLDKHPSYKQQFLVYNNIGLTHLKMHDYKEAIHYLHKSYDLAMDQQKPADEMTVLNNMGIVYTKLKRYTDAETYFLKSYEIAVHEKAEANTGLYATNLANLYYDLKYFEKAEQYINIAETKTQKESRNYISTKLLRNAVLLEKKHPEEVISNLSELLDLSTKYGYLPEKTEVLSLFAKAYQQKENYILADQFLDKALSESKDYEVRKNLFEEKAANNFILGNLREVVSAKDSIISLNKKINDANSKELLENASLKFELSKSNYELNLQRVAKKNQNIIYLLSLFSLLCLFIFILYSYYKRTTLIQQKKIIAENDLTIKKLELEQEINNRLLMQRDFEEKSLIAEMGLKQQQETEIRLKEEIELKNKQLSNKILFQSTRNELLETIVALLHDNAGNKNSETLFSLTNDLKMHLKEDTKWEEFNQHFENINNRFLEKLNGLHPDLNANDVRFLSFIFLNLTTKEMANLLHITPESCRKRKERLRIKLLLPKETDLYQYLISI